jgi:hypothetical protein
MKSLVFLLEERSAKALLEGFLPRWLPDGWQVRYVVFEGKQDLENGLVRRLRGWLTPNTWFVVLRDQDAGDCRRVRDRLVELVRQSGREALVRVACRELESWVLGDLQALAAAFEEPRLTRWSDKAKYRNPDELHRPVDEVRRLVPSYQKVDGARRVGPLLEPQRNLSPSFRAFCAGIERLCGERG